MTRVSRIGLVGHVDVTARDVEAMRTDLPAPIMAFLQRHHHSHVEILTPLAPGADVALTLTVMGICRRQGASCQLSVVRALPDSVVWRRYQQRVGAAREFQSFHEERVCLVNAQETRVIDIQHQRCSTRQCGAAREAQVTRAFRRANVYLASRVDLLVAYYRVPGQAQGLKPGGTGHAVAVAEWLAARRRRPDVLIIPLHAQGRQGIVNARQDTGTL